MGPGGVGPGPEKKIRLVNGPSPGYGIRPAGQVWVLKNPTWTRSVAIPTLTCMESSKKMLLGFKSRWITLGFCPWRYYIAWAISNARANLSSIGGRGTILSFRLLPSPCSHSFSVMPNNSVTTHPCFGGSMHTPIRWSTNGWRCLDKVLSSWAKNDTPFPFKVWK